MRANRRTAGGGRSRFALWALALSAGALFASRKPRERGRIARAEATGSRGASQAEPASFGDSRGRQAETPSEIPARGWKDILLRVWQNVSRHRVLSIAGGIAYFELLAIFPAIAALVSLYGLFADPKQVGQMLDQASGVLPGGMIQVLHDQISRIAAQSNGRLGFAFIVGLIISLWSANSGLKALFDALNIVYDEPEKRGFFRLNAVTLGSTAGAVVLLLAAMAVIAVIPQALHLIGFGALVKVLIDVLRWPALLLLLGFGLALLYRYGPSRNTARWRWVSWGSAAATIAWIVVSMLFSWYAAHFGSYNKTYGSLGAVIGFMTWLWISAVVVLLGAELDAEMEHQTARDSTTGREKPMGRRGAKMADTLGAAQD